MKTKLKAILWIAPTRRVAAIRRIAGMSALVALIALALISCSDGGGDSSPKPKEQPIEKTYLVPSTKVTIKYMDLASHTDLPAEVSKLAGIFTHQAGAYSTTDRTIYVINGSSSGPEVQSDGTMKIGRTYVSTTDKDDVDDAIDDLRTSWLA